MTIDLADILDAALEQLHTGEPPAVILAHYPADAEALVPLLEVATALETIRPVEMPAPEALLSDRNVFLAETVRLPRKAVSPGPLVRLREWIAHQIPWRSHDLTSQRKEQRPMSALLIKVTLIFGLIFGSAGGAVALAAGSLPDSPLYPAKMAMEQTRLSLTAGPANQAALHLNLAQERVQEMARMALGGRVPDQATLNRLQTHLNLSLNLAAQLPDENMLRLLNQAGQMIQTQERELRQVQTGAAEPAQEPLRQASRLLYQFRGEVEAGLQDPQTFRWRHTENRPEAPAQPDMVPMPGGNPDCPTDDCEPVRDQYQAGPPEELPASPGEPGGPVRDQNQTGPPEELPAGPGEAGGPVRDQYQAGPPEELPAGPGEAGGRARDQYQDGPPEELPAGPGEPVGPGDTCTDCEPVGDEYHNGPQSTPTTQFTDSDGQGDSSSPADNAGCDGCDPGGHSGGKNH